MLMAIPVLTPCEKSHSAPYYRVCVEFLILWPPGLHYLRWYKDVLLRFLDREKENTFCWGHVSSSVRVCTWPISKYLVGFSWKLAP